MSRNLIVVDLETTGLGPQCAPIEVAAINVDTGETLEFVPYIDLSKVSIEPQAFAINRYFERGVYEVMLTPDETTKHWMQFRDMLRKNTFAGCSPAFDARIVANACTPTWHYRLADLAAYAAPALGRGPSELPGLADVLNALKIENRCPHSALGDAEATAKAFEKLRDIYAEQRESAR
ncbi:3'-5' exonuclease [Mycobacteroides abscessus]|uniref:3'-5' exonuclease n=1 Tax=Mycobacteroides abscessus TaxID=36809 RepID=UPI0009A74AE7|nr:exonuclease domain-containing protein [Mycobacteroides abscessus]QSM88302.1 3'-5' exoribonuclease [Mycobacteroides abscessus subsp. bolletii]QST90155.1 DnaQ-like DNA polymerase III subunit [Mycobacterium phage prophi91-1]SKS70872.1 Exonuclease [Mycobacteroides abscessus subsp. bolletii]SLD12794.1 Exonuclease [Mycobacteroides abscessus subsp. bolletii]